MAAFGGAASLATLPVELLRLIYSYSDPPSVRSLRVVTRLLADVGYEFLIPPKFVAQGWKDDIDRLHSIALHRRLQDSIESIVINLSDLDRYSAKHAAWAQSVVLMRDDCRMKIGGASKALSLVDSRYSGLVRGHSRCDDLREAFSALPNFKSLEVTFTQYPGDNDMLRQVFDVPGSRKFDREQAQEDLDAIIFALHGIRLSKFSVDRFPLETFRMPGKRKHWFAHANSFDSLSTLSLTMDPSGLRGPTSSMRAINGLGRLLQLAPQLSRLKLAFHPYASESSKFVLSFRELLEGFTFTQLKDLMLEGISCDEEDLKDFLVRHRLTLERLRLGGRGLSKQYECSKGGIHLHDGTFKSLFTGLHNKLTNLQRLHLEGIFECEPQEFPTHETYNFYALTNEEWEPIPMPTWVRESRKTINGLPFEQYVLSGGVYPGSRFAQQQF